MLTSGYDFVVELNERFLNRALAAAFYTTSIPDALRGNVRRIPYLIKLNEPPTIDAFSREIIKILFYINARIKKFGITFEFDIKINIEASPKFDQSSRKLMLNLLKARIEDIRIGDKRGWLKLFAWRIRLPRFILNLFNSILVYVINSGVLDRVETIDISPILGSMELPYMPQGPGNLLTIGLGNAKVLDQSVLAVCVNFLDYNGGNIEGLTNFSADLDFCAGVSESAMHRVFDFWWARTTHPKSVTSTGSMNVPVVADLLSAVGNGFDLAAEAATMGFVEPDLTINRAWVDYGATVAFSKPSFNLLNGNKVELSNCRLKIHAWASAKINFTVSMEIDTSGFIPDSWTPWKDDKTIARQTSTATICTLAADLDITINKATAKVYLDDSKRLMAKVERVEVTINLPWRLPEVILSAIVNWIIGLIIDRIPPIPLSPAVITKEIPGTSLTLRIDIHEPITTNDDEAIVGAALSFEQIPMTVKPIPKFIVDTRPSSTIVTLPDPHPVALSVTATPGTGGVVIVKGVIHRSDCLFVNDIWERHKVGFCVLADGLNKGCRPCPECLPEYQGN